MVASQRGRCVGVVVHGGETFPGDCIDSVECVELGSPYAGLDAIERGHVGATTTTPEIENVGIGVMDDSCTDAGDGSVGRGFECALYRGTDIENVDCTVDGDSWLEFARVEEETTGVCHGCTVRGARVRRESRDERPAKRHFP